jgi:hypothetical protein
MITKEISRINNIEYEKKFHKRIYLHIKAEIASNEINHNGIAGVLKFLIRIKCLD